MSASSQSNVDLDALLDLTEYEGLPNYTSPSVSPGGTSKPQFASPVNAPVTTPSYASSTSQTLSGPSHNYDMYRQQTGFVPGALASTMAVNQSNNTGYQDYSNIDYLNMSPENDIFDFNTSPSQATMGASEMDIEFDSPTNSQQNFFSTVNPGTIEQEQSPPAAAPAPVTGNVGRLWPGAHSQAAMAKANAQRHQQQQQIMQQQMQRQSVSPPQQKARGKAPQPTDPLVEQKITQLLQSMRSKPSSPPGQSSNPTMVNLPKSKKEEEEMDEDERLLASEEGKKLSSKERRQLRNKVSARAFRSRRKEYITQLEAEIATKVNENGDLRAQNRALLDENKRLSDLTRMLLSSASFSSFLDQLSANSAVAQPQQQQQAPQQQQQQQQAPKDLNPNGAQQQIGMAMIPEQTMDFSMLSMNGAYYQPQVFVVDTPEMPDSIDTAALSGKSSNFVESCTSNDDKIEVPTIEYPIEKAEAVDAAPVDDEFESDPEYALYHTESAAATSAQESKEELDTDGFSNVDIFSGIDAEKVLSRYELVDASEGELSAALAMARIQSISANAESVLSRLELLTMDL